MASQTQALYGEPAVEPSLSDKTRPERGAIEVTPFSPAETIGRWRTEVGLSGSPKRSISETLFGGATAAALNVALLYLVLSDIGFGAPPTGRPHPALDPDTVAIRAYLIDTPSPPAPPAAAGRIIAPLEPAGPRVELPKKSPETDNNSTRNRDAVTLITHASTVQTDTERLQAIYRTQISARLKRSLEDAHLAPGHRCSVQIDQSPTGRIVAVIESHCGTDERWQSRLIAAIRGSAPLPTPPRGDLFQSRLAVEFNEDVKVTW